MAQFYVAARARVDRMKNLARNRFKKIRNTHCCQVFINSLMALLSRLLYLGHALLSIWRTSEVIGYWYWTVSLWLIALIVETCVVVFTRGGREWKWFQPCIMIYLMVELPSICMLELEKATQIQMAANASDPILEDLIARGVKTSGVKLKIAISEEWWALLLNQSMMILLIIARWLMPKGDLTRDQLSGLLLYYLGTASDIVDFFSVLSEGDDLLLNKVFIYTILVTWVWSMFQFVFVVTMTVGGDAGKSEDDNKPADDDKMEKGKLHVSKEFLMDNEVKLSWWKRLKKNISIILASEAWAITISMVMQDGPFACVRLLCLFYWNIRTYTNYFFTFKNVLVLCLQIYRLVAVYEEYKKSKAQEEEEHKEELHDHLRNAKLKTRAITALTMGFKKKKIAPAPDVLEDYSDEETDVNETDMEETDVEETEVEETEVEETDAETTYRSDTTGSITPVSC